VKSPAQNLRQQSFSFFEEMKSWTSQNLDLLRVRLPSVKARSRPAASKMAARWIRKPSALTTLRWAARNLSMASPAPFLSGIRRSSSDHRPGRRALCFCHGARLPAAAGIEFTMTETENNINVAFHEAAHAVTAVCLGVAVERASVRKKGTEAGHVEFNFRKTFNANRGRCSDMVVINGICSAALAGALIEKEVGESFEDFEPLISRQDWEMIQKSMEFAGIPDWLKRDHLRAVLEQSKALLARKDVRMAIGDVARELLERKEVDGRTVRALVERHVALS
jgi:hypothetical protein